MRVRLRRQLGRWAGAAVYAARNFPVLGRLARLVWPDLEETCRVEITRLGGRGDRPSYRLEALLRKRVVARWGVHKSYLGIADPSEWWLSGAYTHQLYRRRGASRLLLRRAMEVARGQGAEEVFVAVAEDNHPSLRLLTGAGFAPLEDQDVARRITEHYRRGEPDHPRVVVLRQHLCPEPPAQIGSGDGDEA